MQQARGTLADLEKKRQDDAELQDLIAQTPEADRDKATLNFYKTRDRDKAFEFGNQIMKRGNEILKFDPEGGVDYINSKLGTDFKYTGKQGALIKIEDKAGGVVKLIDPNTGKQVNTVPITKEGAKPQSKRGIKR